MYIRSTDVNILYEYQASNATFQVLYYTFAIIGMEIFQGLVHFHGYNESDPSLKFCGNPALNNSMFYRAHYCNNNFNDLLNSFVVMFELTVVNQWHGILLKIWSAYKVCRM